MAEGKVMIPGSIEYVVEDDSSLLFRLAGWLDRILDGRLINEKVQECDCDD